jgi:hypothetical protein
MKTTLETSVVQDPLAHVPSKHRKFYEREKAYQNLNALDPSTLWDKAPGGRF